MISVAFEKGKLVIRFPYNPIDVEKAHGLPERRFNKTLKAWTCKASLANIEYIERTWSNLEWSKEANTMRFSVHKKRQNFQRTLDTKLGKIDLGVLTGVPFKYPPMEHQGTALVLGRDQTVFAYLMDQGTGKTKVVIDDACHNWRKKRIDVVIVLTINSVKTNWVIFEALKDEPEDVDAVDTHMPPDVPYVKGVWVSQPTGAVKKEWRAFEKAISEQTVKRDKLVWLAVNIETTRVARGYDFLEQVIKAFNGRVMIVVDESTIIGAPGSKQTVGAIKLREQCSLARIMSGTPVIKSPLKAYSQFKFLDEDILGFGSFYAFKAHHCVMGGFEDRQVLFYKNLEELQQRISSTSYRVLKSQCLTLPEQRFLKRRIKMTPDQMRAYAEMQAEFRTQNANDEWIEAKIILEQILRLQQITGGYLPKEGGGVVPIVDPENNPKFREVLHIMEEAGDQKVLIWTRFTHEILDLVALLNKKGFKALPFYGGLDDKEKIGVRKTFARGEHDSVVGNPAAGGLGIDEFKIASISAYVTNSFDTERRKQSEDRTHRIGSEIHMDTGITYWDIVAPGTVDIKVLSVMRNNLKISAAVMQDEWREWI